MQWIVLKSHQNLRNDYEKEVSAIWAQYEAWEQEQLGTTEPQKQAAVSKPIAVPKVQNKPTEAVKSTANPTIIHITVIAGPHTGETFALKPSARAKHPVGRSRSAKFVEKGISLHKDLEVSTTHGHLFIKAKQFYFTDANSTNGSRVVVNGTSEQRLEPNEPVVLEQGMQLVLGQSTLEIKLE